MARRMPGGKARSTGILESTVDGDGAARRRARRASSRCSARRSPPRPTRSARNSSRASTEADPDNARFFRPSERAGHAYFDLPAYIVSRLSGRDSARAARSRPVHLCRRGALLLLSPRDASGRAGLRPPALRDHAGRGAELGAAFRAGGVCRTAARAWLEEMARRKLDALLLFAPESHYWLTGYDTFGYLLLPVPGADARRRLHAAARAPPICARRATPRSSTTSSCGPTRRAPTRPRSCASC